MRHPSALIKALGRCVAVPALLLLTGCVATCFNPGIRTRAHLYDAYHAWENGRNAEALAAIKLALVTARKEKIPGDILVEVYDDAGLYFHLAGQHEESVRQQAVAVLLARKFELSRQMIATYENRLSLALASADPAKAQDVHARDTERLLAIPGVGDNPHIRKYYGLK